MLNPFPELLYYGGFAPFVLRIVLGFLFLSTGYLKLKTEEKRWATSFKALGVKRNYFAVRILGIVEIIAGALVLIGFYTQIGALVIVLISFSEVYIESREELIIKRSLVFYLMALAISLSLLFSGAGFFAFDIPL